MPAKSEQLKSESNLAGATSEIVSKVEINNLTNLTNASGSTGVVAVESIIENSFEKDLKRLEERIKELKKESRSKVAHTGWVKIVYYLPGTNKGVRSDARSEAKNIFTFEGKCIKVKNNGLHTKIILENSLNIVQQFCVYASNILQLSIHTHTNADILYTHPQFKKRN